MALLNLKDLTVQYDQAAVVNRVNLSVHPGERWAIIGRNGAGKSTLVKTIAGLIKPKHGSVLLNDQVLEDFSARARAKTIAYVPQKLDTTIPYSVYDFVMLGRYAAMGLFSMPETNDHDLVSQALTFCDVADLQDRMMPSLSGGEMQRVLLAGALVQQASLLLLDEPTSFLDPAHERHFFDALDKAFTHNNFTILIVTHDINTAILSCTHVLALFDGTIHYCGTSQEFKSRCPEILNTLYGIPFEPFASTQQNTLVYGTWGQQ